MTNNGFLRLFCFKKKNCTVVKTSDVNTATVLIESLPVADEFFRGWFAVPCMGDDR